ncbi:MAG: YceI family protein [Acidobacteria bacterium]|nr:YceI family protein [Acidobacteriota bacterium]
MASATQTAAGTTTWKIDPTHTHVEFAVKHMMITTVKGRFSGVTGEIRLDEPTFSASKVDIDIEVATIDTREPQRDTHLRSGDFFDVEKYPKISFRSTSIDGTLESFKLSGDLTIHGVTRPATLDVTYEGRGKDPWGGERIGFAATAKIKRSDFGLTWNAALETGGFLVGDDVKISLDVEAVKG